MIRARNEDGDVVLAAELEAGSTAYIDADWILADSAAEVPAVLVSAEGVMTSGAGQKATLPATIDADAAAGAAFLSWASEAAAAVERSEGEIEVVGNGMIAHLVSLLVGDRAIRWRDDVETIRPVAVVDTTGDPALISEATRRVADLGTIVLAGEANGRRLTLDLYPDVHVRGLRLVGVSPLLDALPDTRFHDPCLELFRDALESIESGRPIPRAATCYRVSA